MKGQLKTRLMLIREIVEQALTTGYLTREAENELRQRLRSKYDLQDFRAFMELQNAVIEGHVQQESRSFQENLLSLRNDYTVSIDCVGVS